MCPRVRYLHPRTGKEGPRGQGHNVWCPQHFAQLMSALLCDKWPSPVRDVLEEAEFGGVVEGGQGRTEGSGARKGQEQGDARSRRERVEQMELGVGAAGSCSVVPEPGLVCVQSAPRPGCRGEERTRLSSHGVLLRERERRLLGLAGAASQLTAS